ncbi:MAG: hypothetical protein EPN65_05195 [Pandoraea sp.]|uniref:hypothetical protein n=1 Tax=Pandoraea sp. TaxID=1883445 RepID=UPI00121D9A2F|nr:hypothetical protein [Pandoraea sp.]TAM18965.1 MAG: hypothetical protein EPN65_05195 [Pandoraea sp.]
MIDLARDFKRNRQILHKKYDYPDNDNHSNQLNPNNDEYWHSRGEDERPDDWEERTSQSGDAED